MLGYFLSSEWTDSIQFKIIGGWVSLGVLSLSLAVNALDVVIGLFKEVWVKVSAVKCCRKKVKIDDDYVIEEREERKEEKEEASVIEKIYNHNIQD